MQNYKLPFPMDEKKNVVVMGMGKSGISAARLLHRHNFSVFVSESKKELAESEAAVQLINENISFETGKHSTDAFLSADFIVISPGVPESVPVIQAAIEHKIPIYSEIEVASWFCQAPIIGITGSNGKTTTTSLIGEIVKTQVPNAFVGGNIGIPFSDAADKLTADNFAVLELSSFQLERIQTFHPHVAVLLNFTPDHLDRHLTYQNYISAKCKILSNQTKNDFIVYNADDGEINTCVEKKQAALFPFGKKSFGQNFVGFDRRQIYYQTEKRTDIIETKALHLVGEHNYANVCAAIAAALCVGIPMRIIRKSIAEFRPVEHRIEFVGEIDGVQFYNDSKATNSDATEKALQSFSQPVILLAGGHAKEKDYSHLKDLVVQRVKKLFLFGENREQLYHDLKFDGKNTSIKVANLSTAFDQACKVAMPGDIILLSPACASTDQYLNFEERGKHFKELFRMRKNADSRKTTKPKPSHDQDN